MHKVYISFLLLIIFITGIINYFVFKTHQAELVFKSRISSSDESITYDEINAIFPTYPNISAVGTPVDVFKATLALRENKIITALDHLDKARKINPHTHVSDVVLGEFYLGIGVLDSAEYYAKKGFYGWPKNLKHYEVYNQVLTAKKDTLEIINAYNSLDSLIKKDKAFFNNFYKYFNKAKLSYLIKDYPDRKPVTDNLLQGSWIRSYIFPNNQVIRDSSMVYTFNKGIFTIKDGTKYKYSIVNDSVYIYFLTGKLPINKLNISYSDSLSTLIFKDVKLENVTLDQFFKKLDE